MEKITTTKNNLNNSTCFSRKKSFPLWFIALFATFELTFIVQSLCENNIIFVEKDFFVPDFQTIFYLTLFSLFLFIIILFVLKNHLNLCIDICVVVGIIASIFMLISNLLLYTIGFYINSCVSTLLSFLTFTYICVNFNIKSAILEVLIGSLFFKLPMQFLNHSKFEIPFDISITLMLIAYITFITTFIILNIKLSKNSPSPEPEESEIEEPIEEESNVAKNIKEPPYLIYTAIVLISFLLAIIQSLNSTYVVNTENLRTWSNIFFMLSLAICFILVLFKDHIKFFDIVSILTYIYVVGTILMFFNNNITKIIGSCIIGFCNPLFLIYLPIALIMYDKTNKISTPFWLICLNFVGIKAFDKILNKITSINGFLVLIIILCILLIAILYFAKPYLKFASIGKTISYEKKNSKDNPYSYLSDLELNLVNLMVEGYTINQIINILDITPQRFKEVKLCVYHLLNVKTRIELIENSLDFNYKRLINNKNKA